MIKLGEFNKLKVKKKTDYGFFLDGRAHGLNSDILLPKSKLGGNKLSIGDTVDVFIYRDGSGRLCATLVKPKAVVNEISILEVVENTDIGTFIDIGTEKNVLVPFRERTYPLFTGRKYPFYMYIDKSNRLAATTNIHPYLSTRHEYKIGDTVSGYVYNFQTNGTAEVCVEGKFLGIILPNECYEQLRKGDYWEGLRVIRIYDDHRLGLSARAGRSSEIEEIYNKILSYMQGNDGFMRFNDKSDPEDIKIVFGTSKKAFKRTLGLMMKRGIVRQDEAGTYLLKKK